MKGSLLFISILIFLLGGLLKAQAQTDGSDSGLLGDITACAGTPSSSPNIEEFTVNGQNLIGAINIIAPQYFEVSLSPTTGFQSGLSIEPINGIVDNVPIYLRSSANAPVGVITASCLFNTLGIPGNAAEPVRATIIAPASVNVIPSQTRNSGQQTAAVHFTGTGDLYQWINDTPSIGLAASGAGNIAPFIAVNKGSSPVTATIMVTPEPAPFTYITQGNGTVLPIDMTTGKASSPVKAGDKPDGIAVSPEGSRIYVTNFNSNNVNVISTFTHNIIQTIPVGSNPVGVTVSPDGRFVYVSNTADNTLSVIDAVTNRVKGTVPTGQYPVGMAASHDGNMLYVVNKNDGTVSVIYTPANVPGPKIPVGAGPIGVVFSADDSRVYVTNNGSNNVSVINASTNAVIATIAVGVNPYGITISPDGSMVYVANEGSNTVSVINTANNTVAATVEVGVKPIGISADPSGSNVYAVNTGSSDVSVISTATNTVSSSIATGPNPVSFGNFFSQAASCGGMPSKFTITVNPAATAFITATGSPSALNTIYGTPSSATTFNVSGIGMKAGILVSPPPGFEISADDINFSSTVTIGAAGVIASTVVYIRLAAATHVGPYSGNIVLSSLNADNIDVVMPVSTVSPAPLTITADNKNKSFGHANPLLTLSYTGFVNGDGPAQLAVQATISTTATTASAVGQYPITAVGASSADYTITYVPGVLTINPPPPVIIVPNTFTPNHDGINDTWEIKNIDFYLNCTVNVYNRYGEKVYSSIGYTIPWDGTYNGSALPTGTYYYIIDLKKELKVLSGYVVIIR